MKFQSKRNIIKLKKFIFELLKMTVGTIIMAIGIELFLVPSQLSTGGFSGIATIGYYMTGISVGTIMLLLNIPLFIIAFFKVGRTFFVKTVIGTSLLSIFLNLLQAIKPITQDRFLAFIYGSVIVGIGTAIVLNANGSTGGTELLANVIKSYKPYLKTGTLIVILDTIVITANTIYFKDIEIALYSTLVIYVMGKVLDIFFEGIDFAKMVLIISPEWEKIAEGLSKNIKRGVTSLYGHGMYRNEDKNILLCVMSRAEVREARKVIKEIDPKAFLVITNAREVYGEGFKK